MLKRGRTERATQNTADCQISCVPDGISWLACQASMNWKSVWIRPSSPRTSTSRPTAATAPPRRRQHLPVELDDIAEASTVAAGTEQVAGLGDEVVLSALDPEGEGIVSADLQRHLGKAEGPCCIAHLLGRLEHVSTILGPQLADGRSASIGVRFVPKRDVTIDEIREVGEVREGVRRRHAAECAGRPRPEQYPTRYRRSDRHRRHSCP
jgi:hypothetical protein